MKVAAEAHDPSILQAHRGWVGDCGCLADRGLRARRPGRLHVREIHAEPASPRSGHTADISCQLPTAPGTSAFACCPLPDMPTPCSTRSCNRAELSLRFVCQGTMETREAGRADRLARKCGYKSMLAVALHAPRLLCMVGAPRHAFKTKAPNKADLPSKVCKTCNRPFTWRKKWEAVWEDVKCAACARLWSRKHGRGCAAPHGEHHDAEPQVLLRAVQACQKACGREETLAIAGVIAARPLDGAARSALMLSPCQFPMFSIARFRRFRNDPSFCRSCTREPCWAPACPPHTEHWRSPAHVKSAAVAHVEHLRGGNACAHAPLLRRRQYSRTSVYLLCSVSMVNRPPHGFA